MRSGTLTGTFADDRALSLHVLTSMGRGVVANAEGEFLPLPFPEPVWPIGILVPATFNRCQHGLAQEGRGPCLEA